MANFLLSSAASKSPAFEAPARSLLVHETQYSGVHGQSIRERRPAGGAAAREMGVDFAVLAGFENTHPVELKQIAQFATRHGIRRQVMRWPTPNVRYVRCAEHYESRLSPCRAAA